MYDQRIILQGVFFFLPLVCARKIFTDGLFVRYDIHLQIMRYARVVGLPLFTLFVVLFPFFCFLKVVIMHEVFHTRRVVDQLTSTDSILNQHRKPRYLISKCLH